MADLKLSPQLMEDVQNLIINNDEEAKDPAIALQYLAAITGYILGTQDLAKAQKDNYMEQINAFAKHVMDDVSQPAPPPVNAFGVWKPKD